MSGREAGRGRDGARPEDPPRLEFEQERLFSQAIETIVGMLETQGVSQRELAARIDRNDAQVNRLIRSAGNTSLKSLARLAYGLGFRFALVPIPFEDREGTPAASDPPPPPWLEKQRRRRATETPATAPEELNDR